MSVDDPPTPCNLTATYVCGGCGAALVLDLARASAICNYCGSRLIDRTRTGAIDRICAFRVSRPAARERLRQHLADAWYAPSAIRRLARTGTLEIDALTGVLVPFIAYAARFDLQYRAEIGIDWFTYRTAGQGNRKRVERVRHTEWLPLRGTAAGDHGDHLECASISITDAEAMSLAPFDLGAALRFAPELMAGFAVELPTRTRDQTDEAARGALVRRARRRLEREWLPGDHARVVELAGDVEFERADVVLLPVWVASYRHAGKVRRVLVHGQDGRCVGRPPVSLLRVSLLAASIAAALVLLGFLVGVFR